MAEHCVLCRKELDQTETDTISIDQVQRPVCRNCKQWYYRSSPEEQKDLQERARVYLDSLVRKIPVVLPQLLCPNCGAAMECKLTQLSIGADGGGGLSSLFYEQYNVDLYACPQCGKVELYTAGFRKKLAQAAQAEQVPPPLEAPTPPPPPRPDPQAPWEEAPKPFWKRKKDKPEWEE